MKLPALTALLKAAGTAGQIDASQRAIETAAATIAGLEAERQIALAGSDDVGVVRKIDRHIEEQRAVIKAHTDRLEILRVRLADEQRQYREREHWKAVEHFETALPARLRAAAKLEKAIGELATAMREFEAAATAARRTWPQGMIAWGASALDTDRAGDLLANCISPGGLWRRLGNQIIAGPTGAEYAATTLTADERARGFAGRERQHHERLMDDLRSQPVPHPEPAPVDDELAA